MPGTAVGIALKAVVLFSGLGSKVSMWLAPPTMNKRMQLLCAGLPSADWAAARAASVLSQPEAGRPKAPAAENRSQSRRDRFEPNMIRLRFNFRRLRLSGRASRSPAKPQAAAKTVND